MTEKRVPEFAVWDVTEPIDSIDFIKLMRQRLRWRNLLDDVPLASKDAMYIQQPEKHSIFMPCGEKGEDTNPRLFKEAPVFQKQVFAPNHGTGRDPALLYVSSHGIPGFIFSSNTEAIPIVRSNLIGAPGNPGTISPPAYQWNSTELKYVILSSCRPLAGKPQQALWARAMRGKRPLHGILGYRGSSPAAGYTTPINKRFVEALATGQTFLNAWKTAHRGLRKNWAVLIHKEALKDTAVQWTRDGHLRSNPSAQGEILYYDSKTSGRKIEEPKRYFDLTLLRPQKSFEPGQALPSWTGVKTGNLAWICIELTKASNAIFEPGDRIWISAAQVRPNYEPPFDIRELFSIFLPKGDTMTQYGIRVLARIHDRRMFGARDFDTYEFSLSTIRGGTSYKKWLVIDKWLFTDKDLPYRRLYIPIIIGKARFLNIQNNRLRRQGRHHPLPLFYLMGRIEKKKGKSFGIPVSPRSRRVLQKDLIDDFQFAVFVLLSALPKGRIHN